MSAHALIEILKRVDYPDAEKLDPHSLDWSFEDPATASFMQWVCSIGKENVLSEEELEEYESLKKAGKTLTGSHLKEALAVSSSYGDNSGNDASRAGVVDDDFQLQSDVENLEETLERLQEETQILVKERKQLDAKQIALKTKQSKVDELANQVKRSYDDVLNLSSAHSFKIDQALKKLSESVKNITKLYTTDFDRGIKFGSGKSVEDAKFLSQVDLSRYHQAEERFSQDLTAYTKKRFFEGMADIAGQKETDQYTLLDVSHPENIPVDDCDDKDSFLEDCQEFALLQKIFPESEINRLNALVNAKRAMGAVEEAKSILNSLRTDKFPTSSSMISHLQSKAEEHIRQSCDEASQYQSAIPDLVKQLGTLQGTEILTGNYELKLKRQDYFTKNQDRVIEYLEGQRSRSELLLMLYELELRFHERTHHLLCAAEKMLQLHLQAWNQRMKCLDDPDLSRGKFERNVVDARDTSCNNMYQMMAKCPPNQSVTEDRHLYLPLDKVKDRATTLYSTYESSQASRDTEDEALRNNTSLLEDCVVEGVTALYAESSTSNGLPNLSPADVQASMISLQGHISSLQSNVVHIVTDVKNKKKLLKRNPVLVKEREMFSVFHTKPDHLISIINGLEENLKRHDAK